MSGPETHPIQREFCDFYRTPRGEFTPKGSWPNLTTHPTLSSNVKFMNFTRSRTLRRFSLVPCSSSRVRPPSKEFSEEAYKLAAKNWSSFQAPVT